MDSALAVQNRMSVSRSPFFTSTRLLRSHGTSAIIYLGLVIPHWFVPLYCGGGGCEPPPGVIHGGTLCNWSQRLGDSSGCRGVSSSPVAPEICPAAGASSGPHDVSDVCSGASGSRVISAATSGDWSWGR